jgi:GNAT superfamily N-acetyltransferase
MSRSGAVPATIRPAKPADQRVLCELYQHLNPADPPWPTDAVAADALAKVLAHDGTTILIAEVDGIAVSTCMLMVCPNFSRQGRPFALIENVVTHREHRRQGYGRQVVEHAIELARQQGCYRVTLMTGSRRDETLRFYEAAGMQRNTKTAFEKRF